MLITDGAMEDFQEVFEEFNWPERRVRRPRCRQSDLRAPVINLVPTMYRLFHGFSNSKVPQVNAVQTQHIWSSIC